MSNLNAVQEMAGVAQTTGFNIDLSPADMTDNLWSELMDWLVEYSIPLGANVMQNLVTALRKIDFWLAKLISLPIASAQFSKRQCNTECKPILVEGGPGSYDKCMDGCAQEEEFNYAYSLCHRLLVKHNESRHTIETRLGYCRGNASDPDNCVVEPAGGIDHEPEVCFQPMIASIAADGSVSYGSGQYRCFPGYYFGRVLEQGAFKNTYYGAAVCRNYHDGWWTDEPAVQSAGVNCVPVK